MGIPVRVTKEATFDCAHMLSGHASLCRNLHGHTYKIQVELVGNLCERGTDEGMVMDFANLKQMITNIVGRFDHAFIYNMVGGTVELGIANLLVDNGMRVVALPFRPTAEHMSKYFFDAFSAELEACDYDAKVFSIKLWETPTSFAEYRG